MSEPTAMELLRSPEGEDEGSQIIRLVTLAARVEKVLALHRRIEAPNPWCEHCIGDSDDPFVSWPCPTVRLLNGEEP